MPISQDARDALKDMGVYYLPSDLKSFFTGEPSRRKTDTWGWKEWTEYNTKQASKKFPQQLIDDAKVYKESLLTSKAGTSHPPPSVSTKATKATREPPTLEGTQVSQGSELPTEDPKDDATNDGGNLTTVCGHRRISPGSFPVRSTRTGDASATSTLRPL